MAKLVWAVLCERVIVDQDTNQVSYIDLTEALQARSLPSGLPRLFAATLWAREEEAEELQVRFRLLPPGSTKAITEFETEAITLNKRQRINLNLQGAPVTVEGEHTVTVDYWDGQRYRTAARLPLFITEQSQE